MTAPRFVLTLTPCQGARWADIPPEVRLRGALKSLLRRFGLRCTDVRVVDPDHPEEPPTPSKETPS